MEAGMGAKIEELLPIGSVVWLRDANRPLMIYGVKQTDTDTGQEYDYIGVLYPEGNMGQKTNFLFWHADIERVEFRGFENEARKVFIQKLSELYQEQQNEADGEEPAFPDEG